MCFADQESRRARRVDYGKRQFVNCTKFNVAFVINMLLNRKKNVAKS